MVWRQTLVLRHKTVVITPPWAVLPASFVSCNQAGRLALLSPLQLHVVQRTLEPRQRWLGHVRIAFGRLNATVSQQFLDVPDVYPILKQMSGERVAQGVEMRSHLHKTKSDRHPGRESPDNRRSRTDRLLTTTAIFRLQHTKSKGCIPALLGLPPPTKQTTALR